MATGFTASFPARRRGLLAYGSRRATTRSFPLFAAAAVLVLASSIISLSSSDARLQAQHRMQHTYELRMQLEQFIALMARTEASVRAVALHGSPFFLDRYQAREAEMKDLLAALEQQCRDDPAQLRRVQTLRPLVQRQAEANEAVLRASQDEGIEAAASALANQPIDGIRAMTRIIDDWQDFLRTRVAADEASAAAIERSTRVVLIAGVLLSGLFGAAAVGIVYRAHRAVRATHRRLELARDEAVRASRHKSEFLATVSHEIRTPMNAMVGLAGVLAESKLDDDQREMTQVMVRAGENLLAIIDDLLDLSKIEAGKLRLDPKPVDVCRVAEETLALLGPRAREKNLKLTFDCAVADPEPLLADDVRLRQVLTNLVGNAIKHTDRGAVAVLLSGAREPDGRERIRFTVRDSGPGIPAEMRERLFRPFSQGDAAARRSGSTGLGLAISRKLVELMQGRIDFESEAGKGSTFWFELVLSRAPAAPLSIASAAIDTTLQPLRLLVVEDNPDNQVVARIVLRSLGHAVDLASSSEAALVRLAARRYDAVLMDCHMPGIDGYETTRLVRAGIRGIDPTIPIIGVTAYALAGDREKCLAAGMTEYLTKPIRVDRIAAALAKSVSAPVAPGASQPTLGTAPVAATGADAKVAARAADDAPGVASGPVLRRATESGSEPPPISDTGGEPELDPAIAEMVRKLPGSAGTSLWPEVVAVFKRDVPGRIATLQRLAAAQNGVEVAHCAHTLAGSCGGLGAVRMRTVALRLETAARSGNWPEVSAELTQLIESSRRVHAALAEKGVAVL